jgi:hypothetical protein
LAAELERGVDALAPTPRNVDPGVAGDVEHRGAAQCRVHADDVEGVAAVASDAGASVAPDDEHERDPVVPCEVRGVELVDRERRLLPGRGRQPALQGDRHEQAAEHQRHGHHALHRFTAVVVVVPAGVSRLVSMS